MNDTVKIFALALASNQSPEQHFKTSFHQIAEWGDVVFSPIYVIPCRDGVGADYWNACCLLKSTLSEQEIMCRLKQMENASGRVRPSHHISLDIDLIAWGSDLDQMQFNPKKLPLALDVKIPMWDLWQNELFQHAPHSFPKVIFKSICI
ncbi:2-amino-4-hydroxy-6-hydroxymethyldihydropteridine diphosphokinase [Acinetobacter sp. 194]|uniref:2-amino-4-hydroxy-6- hydroxymethyldihydropteridine diphosphokinase n=1 Tax=Acinetobacter shaoyimingii TaxID=2715164 RepID=UPI00140D4B3C|nr:2-amino-4-hydroxy-6-hydroxymethyldihydropteridine diphosphokinase [Acinetobacter shaoyimingii]NHB57167.1 2-amino-4-hydroxy-6-hydroxymethyldihydropteridine diphosphokinase [Acinetobacter shaoyimingii]